MSEFDQAARTWDQNPARLERARLNANVIREHLKPFKNSVILDFGCGTGMLGFQFTDHRLLFADSSSAMLAEVRKKRDDAKTFLWSEDKEQIRKEQPDFIVSQMVLHHIEDLRGLAADFNFILRTGGQVALIDLEPEDGSFHDGKHKGRLGIEPDELSQALSYAGFGEIRFFPVPPIEKNGRSYPLFLCIARKSGDMV